MRYHSQLAVHDLVRRLVRLEDWIAGTQIPWKAVLLTLLVGALLVAGIHESMGGHW